MCMNGILYRNIYRTQNTFICVNIPWRGGVGEGVEGGSGGVEEGKSFWEIQNMWEILSIYIKHMKNSFHLYS